MTRKQWLIEYKRFMGLAQKIEGARNRHVLATGGDPEFTKLVMANYAPLKAQRDFLQINFYALTDTEQEQLTKENNNVQNYISNLKDTVEIRKKITIPNLADDYVKKMSSLQQQYDTPINLQQKLANKFQQLQRQLAGTSKQFKSTATKAQEYLTHKAPSEAKALAKDKVSHWVSAGKTLFHKMQYTPPSKAQKQRKQEWLTNYQAFKDAAMALQAAKLSESLQTKNMDLSSMKNNELLSKSLQEDAAFLENPSLVTIWAEQLIKSSYGLDDSSRKALDTQIQDVKDTAVELQELLDDLSMDDNHEYEI